MKKLFTLFAAMLFAAGMSAAVITVAPADYDGAEASNQDFNITLQGVQMEWNGALYKNDNSADFRVYAGKSLKLTTADKIASVVIIGYAKKDLAVTVNAGLVTTGASYSSATTKSSWEDPLVVVDSINAKSVTLSCSKQMQAYGIRITTIDGTADESGEDGGQTGDTTVVTPPVVTEITTCAEAREAALSVSADNELYNNGAEYTITGYVTSIKTAYDSRYNNVSFWMADSIGGGEVLQAYRAACESAEAAPNVGDKVSVTGKLTKYGATPEFAAACTFVILERADVTEPVNLGAKTIAEFLALANTVDTCILTGVVDSIMNTTYGNLYLSDSTAQVYVYGVLTAEGVNKQFASLDVEAGDQLTIKAVYSVYNEAPQVKNAVFVSREKGGEVPPTPGEITTCAEAREAALSVSADNELYNNGAEYTITGYVTSIKTAYSSQYNNVSFWMADAVDGGEVLQAYRAACESAEAAPNVGDKVSVTGKLTKYGTTSEFAAACTFVILERADVTEPVNLGAKTIAEFLALANTVDTCILTGVVDSIMNTTYGNLYLSDSTAQVYVYGVLTAEGVSKQFASLDVEAGDQLTIKAVYSVYNEAPQVKNAVFVSREKGGEVPPTPGEITTCAEAREAALSVSADNELYNNGAEYTITGYVTSIKTAYSSQYNNVSFWMADAVDGGEVLQAYRAVCESAEAAPNVGDKVSVTGKLTKYGTTPEFAAACTFVILERADVTEPVNLGAKTIAEFLALANTVDTCILTGVVKNIKMDKNDSTVYNKYGNFDLEDETGMVYIYGLLTAEGEAQQFLSMDIDAGDELTLLATYSEYNGQPQVKNAVYVSHVKAGEDALEYVEQVVVNKVMRNGEVIIIRNGVEYNMLGTEMK